MGVFRAYNQAVFPIQIVLYAMAFAAILFALKKTRYSDRLISMILSLFWFWKGIVYHFIFFTRINNAAWVFGSLFILQGMIFFYWGIFKNNLVFKFKAGVPGYSGAILVLFALLFYPLLSYLSGHIYPSAPTFGLPCPTTIFTLGLLCWVAKKLPLAVWGVPIIWALIGFTASFSLGVYEDISLLAAAVLTSILLLAKRKYHASTQ